MPSSNSNTRKALIFFIAALIIVGGFYLANTAYKKGTEVSNSKDSLKTIRKENGLKIEVLKYGEGRLSATGDILSIHYIGRLENGDKFDSSIDRGVPFNFQLGAGNVVKGWDEGLLDMKVGEKRRLTIPPLLGYGSSMSSEGNIPPNATIVYEVELIKIEDFK
jgi:peptidylprolyl isomerase